MKRFKGWLLDQKGTWGSDDSNVNDFTYDVEHDSDPVPANTRIAWQQRMSEYHACDEARDAVNAAWDRYTLEQLRGSDNLEVNKLRVENLKHSQQRDIDFDAATVPASLKYSTWMDYEIARQTYHETDMSVLEYGAPPSTFGAIMEGLNLYGLFPFDQRVQFPIAIVEAAWQLATLVEGQDRHKRPFS